MYPALKLVGLAVAPLLLSFPIAMLMESSNETATLAAVPKQQAQESISEKRAGSGVAISALASSLGSKDSSSENIGYFEEL